VGGTIETDRRLQPGKILAVYGDRGWGDLVRRGKYDDHVFSDDLVAASVRLIRSWHPEPQPRWLTFVPSSTSGEMVASFAARLAEALHLELRDVIVRVRPGRPQKAMENSSQQARNVYGAFEVRGVMLSTPVLLVDDVVDSRWTLTVIASALREAGSGPVFPFALAKASSR
jgi:ATP-dependent DNA helicase RecQ